MVLNCGFALCKHGVTPSQLRVRENEVQDSYAWVFWRCLVLGFVNKVYVQCMFHKSYIAVVVTDFTIKVSYCQRYTSRLPLHCCTAFTTKLLHGSDSEKWLHEALTTIQDRLHDLLSAWKTRAKSNEGLDWSVWRTTEQNTTELRPVLFLEVHGQTPRF